MQTLTERHVALVDEIATKLDEIVPDWATRVDTETLDLMDGDLCIAGQVFGRESRVDNGYHNGYMWAVVRKDGPLREYDYSGALCMDISFRDIWIDQIRKRL